MTFVHRLFALFLPRRLAGMGRVCVWGTVLAVGAPPPVEDEFVLKAKVVRLALEYVAWPQGTETVEGRREVVVLGQSPFGEEVLRAFRTTSPGRVPIRAVALPRLPAVYRPQVVLICGGEVENVHRILASLKGRPVLTMGDTPGLAEQGVMVNLVRDSGRVRIEINLGAVKAAGLEIASPLLAKCRIVDRAPAP